MNYNVNLVKTRQKRQVQQFKLGKQNTLLNAKTPKIPGQAFAQQLDTYTKKEISISATEAVHIIEKNGHFKSLICHLRPESLPKLKRFGLLPAETPLSQAIAALGGYRQIISRRAHERRKVSSLYQEKIALLDFAQDFLMALEPLECNVNAIGDAQECHQKATIQASIHRAITALTHSKGIHQHRLRSLCAFDKNILLHMEKLYNDLVVHLNGLAATIDKASPTELPLLLKATGPQSLLTHRKEMGMAIIVKTQELNQNLIYSRKARSFFRGELNNACEEALKQIQNYEADPHNPILPAHQGNFNPRAHTIAVDFSGLGPEKIRPIIYALNEISTKGIHLRQQNYFLGETALNTRESPSKNRSEKPSLHASFKNICRSIYYALRQIGLGITYLFINLAIDLPVSFLTTLVSFGALKISPFSSILFPDKKQTSAQPLVNELLDACNFRQSSIGSSNGRTFALLIVNLVKNVGRTIIDSASQLGADFYDLYLDAQIKFRNGERHRQCQTILVQLNDSLCVIEEKNKQLLASLSKQEQQRIKALPPRAANNNNNPISITSKEVVGVPYHLNSGDWHDI